MPENKTFTVLKAERKVFGKNNFVEVARKKVDGPDGSMEFITIARGYLMPNGKDRFKASVTIPLDDDVRKFVSEQLGVI